MRKTDVNGQTMWEDLNGERFKNPNEKPKDLYGWRKVDVNGTIMWESPDGERAHNNK